jgi:hypothetical protein
VYPFPKGEGLGMESCGYVVGIDVENCWFIRYCGVEGLLGG